jgi:hypothetical protein
LAAKPTNADMLKINYLLNPVAADDDASRPATSAYTATYTPTPTSAATPTPGPDTPLTPASTKQQKNGKDNGVVPSGPTKNPVNYRPYESNSNTRHYDSEFRNEMAAQHRAFRICTAGSGGRGLIGDFPKHVPYASEKKGFFAKTGRDSFEGSLVVCSCEEHSANSTTVFQYKFFLPGDPIKDYTVMWDYQIGLMRMTPFFKACGFQKVCPPDCSRLLVAILTCPQTTPAKALKVNPGLIDLCHSITGGALTAQGYWVPFACARAVCLTFCWDIRWALTPIFGPDFVTQCLRPGHPNYKMFRIDNSIIQHAAQEAESWRIYASRSATPASRPSPATYGAGNDPRPLPPTSAPAYTPTQELHPKKKAPEFRLGSPFAHNNHQDYHRSAYQQTPDLDDEPVSPKSSPISRTFPPAASAWTSINRSSNYGSAPPSPPNNTPVATYTPAHNHHRTIANSPGFRNAAGQRSTSPSHIPSQKVLDAARASSRRPPPRGSRKRSRNDGSDDDFDSDNVAISSSSSEADAEAEGVGYGGGFRSEMSVDSDSDNVVTSPPPPPPPSKVKKSKRSRRLRVEDESEGEDGADDGREPRAKRPKDLQWTKADEEAAHILIRLNREDAKLAYLKP